MQNDWRLARLRSIAQLLTLSGMAHAAFRFLSTIYDRAIIATVITSDAGMASHSPSTPIAPGRRMNPGTMNMIPLISIYAIERADFSQL